MKIGDYVRTKHYGISKIIDIYNEDKIELDKVNAFGIKGVCYMTENIIKSSPNIIDLIEVGDYVNGYRVCDSTCGLVIIAPTEDIREMNSIKDEFRNNGLFVSKVYKLEDIEIKSIVTKEQFSCMEYKIGE